MQNRTTVHRAVSHLRSARRLRLQRAGDFLGAVALDDVADFDVVEVLDGDTAFVPLLHFANVVLEAAKRSDGTVVHFHAVAHDANTRLTSDRPVADVATGH